MVEASQDELALMAVVARKHYLGGLSKSEIADELYLSRFKVARLLDSARRLGVVTFVVELPGDSGANLARELEQAFSLQRAVVIDDAADESGQADLLLRLGDATASLLAEVVRPDDLVGVASTRTLSGLQESREPIARCRFVQLTGELPRSDASGVIGSLHALTRLSRGAAHVFYAPMVASSEEAAASYMTQPEVRRAFDLMARLDVVVTGVGRWAPGLSLIYDHLPADVRDEAARNGAVCEAVGVPIDERGHTVHGSARRRIIAPDIEVLRQARHRIGVVFDPPRAAGVKVALQAGIINTVVTHRANAERLLSI